MFFVKEGAKENILEFLKVTVKVLFLLLLLLLLLSISNIISI